MIATVHERSADPRMTAPCDRGVARGRPRAVAPRRRPRARIAAMLGCTVIGMSASASADAIVPFMAVPGGQVVLLPLVIVLEGFVLRHVLGGPTGGALFQSLLANLVSTALGAALYLATMPALGEGFFHWWSRGTFATEPVRGLCIALGFAVALWIVSWASETWVVARLRNTRFAAVSKAIAWANLATYVLLLALALALTR